MLNQAQAGQRSRAPRLLVWCGALALLGAVLLVASLLRPNRGVLGLTSSPRVVLVALANGNGEPGFAGFLAIIHGNGRSLSVVPVPGTVAAKPSDPLWIEAGSLPPAALAHDIGRDAHIKLSGYFILQEPAVAELLETLAVNVKAWPRSLPPDAALLRLGWPTGDTSHRGQAALFEDMMTYLPQLPPAASKAVNAVEAHSKTNLSLYQLFLLGTYIRGDSLQVVPWSHVGRLVK